MYSTQHTALVGSKDVDSLSKQEDSSTPLRRVSAKHY